MRYLTEIQRGRIGLRIRQARKQAGLSHDKLAARVGTSRQHLIKLEHGQHAPKPETLQAIADATGKRVEFFHSDEDDEESDQLESELIRVLRAYVRSAR